MVARNTERSPPPPLPGGVRPGGAIVDSGHTAVLMYCDWSLLQGWMFTLVTAGHI